MNKETIYLVEQKKKYEEAWLCGEQSNSGTAYPFAKYIHSLCETGTMLDMGFGNGLVVSFLHEQGYDVKGVDITLNGLTRKFVNFRNEGIPEKITDEKLYVEAPLWNLPFEDNSFDFTFSCDVMEHIPAKMLNKTILEIERVTRHRTHHVIACFKSMDFHPSVFPIDWWKGKFSQIEKNIRIGIESRANFMKRINENG